MLKPLIKYVGGKRKLAARIAATMPEHVDVFCEPFCGGAAVFAELHNQGRVGKAILNDKNKALMDLYRRIKHEPAAFLSEIQKLESSYYDSPSKENFYYAMRTHWNSREGGPAVFVFLKQTAFNGLWRLNKKGGMNAPWGKYEKISLPSEADVLAWHKALQDVTLTSLDALDPALDGATAYYFDPPYVDTFTSYTAGGFSNQDQVEVVQLAAALQTQGIWTGVSNSMAAKTIFDEHWPTGTQVEFTASDTVSCTAEGRAKRAELFVYGESNAKTK